LDDHRRATGAIRDAGDADDDEAKSSTEMLLGASLGAACVILVAVAVGVVCVVRRRQLCHRKYAYYVRDNQHGNGAVKVSTPARTAPRWIRRLELRGRRLLGMTSVAEDGGQVGDCDAAAVDDDDDELVSSTLQSLLESKQLFDESPPPPRVTTDNDDDEVDKERRLHREVELLDAAAEDEAVDEMKTEPDDVERCACRCVELDVAADDSTSKTDSDQTGQDDVKDPAAPDLLTGDGHSFRRGGVARSPYRRSKPKVSFADCRRPSYSDLASVDSVASSRMSSSPHLTQVAASSDDGVDGVADSSAGVSRHSCICVVQVSDSSPPTCSSTDDTSRTAGVGGLVRRSHSTNAVTAGSLSKVPQPPPIPLLKVGRRQSAAAGGRHNEFDAAGCIDIALPATISGVTEGLFPPPMKQRTYQWRTGGVCCSPRLGLRFSEPTVRRTSRNVQPRAVSQGTEV